MTLTQTTRKYKPVDIDELTTNAGQHGHSDGYHASGKQEIQDISLPSLPLPMPMPMLGTVSNTGINHCTSTVQKVEQLYQSTPRRSNSLNSVSHRRSWTDSRKTYDNAARREYELLLANHRQANHLISVNYFREFNTQEIRTRWLKLKDQLLEQDIIAFAVVEITTGIHVLPDGRHWHYPINRIHYHFLVYSDLSERQLRDIFNRACLDAGLVGNEFGIIYEALPDRAAFEHKSKYILKFGNFANQAILFRPRNEIGKLDKICSIGRWFVNIDGTKANKDEVWKSIVAGWYPNKPAAE